MDLQQLSQNLRQDALGLVFLNVLLQQLGLPVPAVPTLLLAGSLAASPWALGPLVGMAVLASLLADWAWYHAGRRFGYRVLSGLCKLSINPSSCVSQTEARFIRWGPVSLVAAKFVPGFSTVAPPIAGALRMHQPSFLLAAGAGGALWAGLALGLGWLLRDTVRELIGALDRHSGAALGLLGAAALGWLGWKLWQKRRFRRLDALPRIGIDELLTALAGEPRPLLLDLRGAAMVAQTGPIAGARQAEHGRLEHAVADWPRHLPIVTLCACPEDAGAVLAAQRLRDLGYSSVRPLQGGYEAWLAATGTPTSASTRPT